MWCQHEASKANFPMGIFYINCKTIKLYFFFLSRSCLRSSGWVGSSRITWADVPTVTCVFVTVTGDRPRIPEGRRYCRRSADPGNPASFAAPSGIGPGEYLYCLHRKKRLATFPSPAGMSLTKLSPGGNNLYMTSLFPPRVSLVSDIPAVDENVANLFCSVYAGFLVASGRVKRRI